MPQSLKKQHITIGILFLLIPLCVMSFFLIQLYQKELLKQIIDDQSTIMHSLKRNTLDQQISAYENLLINYGGDLRFQDIKTSRETVSIIRQEWKTISKILTLNTSSYFTDGESLIPISQYNSELSLQPSFSGIPPDRDWYRKAMQKDGVYWTKPYFSDSLNEIIITASIRIKDKNRNSEAVLAIEFLLKDFIAAFKKESSHIDEKVLVVLESNHVINLNRKINEPVEYSKLYSWDLLTQGDDVVQRIELNGSSFYSFTLFLDYMNIYLVSLIPSETLTDEIKPVLFLIMTIIFMFGSLLYLGSWIFIRRITFNIDKLNQYMKQVSYGNYQIQNYAKGIDEFMVMNDHLNNLVQTLVTNISYLEISHKSLEDQFHLRTILLHMISHNASTPITILFNNSLDMLEEDESNNEISHMFMAAGSLKVLLENIMVILKLDEGITNTQREIINFNEMTKSLCQMYSPLLNRKKLKLETHIKDISWYGNYFLVKIIIENLLDNAVKYSFNDGSIVIRGYKENQNIIWSIQDNGPGLTEDDRTRIFQKFQRLSARPTGGEASSGIGLYLVKELMSAFKGEIIVEEYSQGEGACLTLIFPENLPVS